MTKSVDLHRPLPLEKEGDGPQKDHYRTQETLLVDSLTTEGDSLPLSSSFAAREGTEKRHEVLDGHEEGPTKRLPLMQEALEVTGVMLEVDEVMLSLESMTT